MAEILNISSQIAALVEQYRLSISKPARRLEDRRTTLNTRLSVLAELRSKLTALHTLAKDLKATGSLSKFSVFSVESSLPTIVTGTATSTAAPGTHTLLVTQLAKADTVISSQLSASATGIADTEGAGTKTIRITVNGVSTDVSFAIEAGQSNETVLNNVAAAINAASGAGVTASVVADTTGTRRLVLTSKQTGSTNAVSLQDVSGTVLATIGLGADVITNRTASSGTAGGYLYSSVDLLDAKFKLDGIDIVRGTNSVSDVLTGVTLDLKATQAPTDTPVTLKIGTDKEKVQTTIQDFIKAYNEALTFLRSKTSVNPDNKTREILASDQVFKDLWIRMRAIVGGVVSSVTTGNPSLLSEIGIKAASDGTLSLSDTAAFEDALLSDVRKVSDLFNSSNGIAVQLSDLVSLFTSSGGQIDIVQNGTQDQLTSIKAALQRTNAQIDRRVEAFRIQFEALQNALNRITLQSQAISRISMQLYGY
ncbi:MAG TPA: flagellar filament capping protein FliD [Bacteroidota bacterium]|nr:flagellar filament capping protein FliD [Bacteroidota bacterium]